MSKGSEIVLIFLFFFVLDIVFLRSVIFKSNLFYFYNIFLTTTDISPMGISVQTAEFNQHWMRSILVLVTLQTYATFAIV